MTTTKRTHAGWHYIFVAGASTKLEDGIVKRAAASFGIVFFADGCREHIATEGATSCARIQFTRNGCTVSDLAFECLHWYLQGCIAGDRRDAVRPRTRRSQGIGHGCWAFWRSSVRGESFFARSLQLAISDGLSRWKQIRPYTYVGLPPFARADRDVDRISPPPGPHFCAAGVALQSARGFASTNVPLCGSHARGFGGCMAAAGGRLPDDDQRRGE